MPHIHAQCPNASQWMKGNAGNMFHKHNTPQSLIVVVLFLICPLAALKNSWGFICKKPANLPLQTKRSNILSREKVTKAGETGSSVPCYPFHFCISTLWREENIQFRVERKKARKNTSGSWWRKQDKTPHFNEDCWKFENYLTKMRQMEPNCHALRLCVLGNPFPMRLPMFFNLSD